MKAKSKNAADSDAESVAAQVEGFIDKFDAKNAALIRQLRKALQQRMPAAHELVYDNYNFFVIGYSSTEKPSDCIVSLAANANGAGLSFYYGATLPDPHRLLQGSGNQNRFIRLPAVDALAVPEVEELIASAIAQGEVPLPASGKGKLIVRSISPKQRPRRKEDRPAARTVNPKRSQSNPLKGR